MSDHRPPDASDNLNDENLQGIGGWLILVVVNLAIVILYFGFALLSGIVQGLPLLSGASIFNFAVISYATVCLVNLFLERKIAGYMLIGLYGVSVVLDILILIGGGGSKGPLIDVIRGGVAFALLLYFMFSKRVQQTLVN